MKFFDVKVFVLACELKNLSAVARELSITPAATSAALKRLESELNSRLLQRSTRSLTLTQSGADFLPYARTALESLDVGRQAISGEELKGNIILSVPSDLGRNTLLSHFIEFQNQYPGIKLTVKVSDKYADFYSQNLDASIRYGEPEDSALVCLPIIRNATRELCASPEYLQQFGTPTKPEELVNHNCLHFSGDDTLSSHWRFYKDLSTVSVKVSGSHVSDNGDYLRLLALKGVGNTYKTGLDVQQDIAEGRLISLLPKYKKENSPLNMVVAHRKSYDSNLVALREFLVKALSN
ncbi:LysR family transcriptional regulator [Shewanella sp. 10N.286.54.B9]|uniref:LysR family transcriptional regulator n=1 Tax=Shewanella sp. 10N.286.54.B9 TaxID=3229719 RepID=UPI0035534560